MDTAISGVGGSPAGANTQVQFNNSGVFGASANLTWDGASFSVGASAETARVAVKGAGATSATKSLLIEDSGATNLFTINNAGQVEVGKDISLAANSVHYTVNAGNISAGNIIYTNSFGGTISASVAWLGGEVRFAGSNAFSAGRGLHFNVLNDNTSTSNDITAIYAGARNNATTARGASLVGIKADAYTDNQSGGTVTTIAGFNVNNWGTNAAGVTGTNAYGLKINDILNSGTLTNTYGIYIGDLTTGTQTNTPFSIYASDASALSYFAGKVGFGTVTAPSTAIHATVNTANTITIQDVVTVGANSTGTAGASFGPGILFTGESDTTNDREMGRFATIWTTATDASREAAFVWQLGDTGGSIAEVMRLDRTVTAGKLSIGTSNAVAIGNTTFTPATSYTIGNSSNALTINSSSTTSGLILTSSGVHTGGTAGITVGTTNFTSNSLSKSAVRFTDTYTPNGGTGTFKYLEFSGTINQTSGGTGATHGIYLNTTLTSVSDYHSIESVNGKIKFTDTQSAGSGSLAGTLLNLAQTWNTSGTPTAVKLNVTDTSSNAASLLLDLRVGGTSKFKADKSGFVTSPTLYSATSGRATAQTAANASVATYTVGAADGTFEVRSNVRVTTSGSEAFRVDVDYTDDGNNARTLRLNFQLLDGTIGTAIAFTNGAVPYHGIPATIRCKSGTAITVKTAGTFTGCTYDVDGLIQQLA